MVRVPACTARVALVVAWLVGAVAPCADAVSVSPGVAARLAHDHSPRIAASEAQLHARGIDMPNTRNPLHLDPTATRAIHGTALVLLLDFPDKPATATPAHFDSLLFTRGWRTGSLRDYYLEVSRGRLDVSEGGVFGWYRMPHDYGWYVDGQRGFGVYPHNAQRLAEDALAAAHAAGVDLADYDNDGPDGVPRSRGSHDDDGLVDGIFLVHAGPGFELTGNYNDIHSHEWGVHTPVVLDGTTAWLYSMEPEDGTVGVFCHEYGHVLGLPDLYDTGDTWGASGVGDWSLMGTGSWIGTLALGDTPVHLDAWSKTQLGFVTADTVRTWRERVSIAPTETAAGQIFRLATPGRPPSEYFLVENRQPLGFDRGIRGPGLVIYHVDESVARNDDPLHYKVAVVQADGLHQLEGKNFPDRGDGGDPFPGASARARFGGDTRPSNAYYQLGPSQVALEIQGEVGFDILARLFSTTSSYLQVRAAEPQWRVTPSGAVTPSRITITLENDGLLAGRITLAVRSLVPGFATGAVTPAYIDALPSGSSVSAEVALAGDHTPALARLEVRTDAASLGVCVVVGVRHGVVATEFGEPFVEGHGQQVLIFSGGLQGAEQVRLDFQRGARTAECEVAEPQLAQ